jgi:hypothetical protein
LFVGPGFGLKTFKCFYGPQTSANSIQKLQGLNISKDLSAALSQSLLFVGPDFDLKK